ncbi:MAG: SUMF1/EgtB/PvdO family nonheme iron enzyme [Egibacteraceae bacterium]
MARREPIAVPWRINRVRVLGPLEIYVVDDQRHSDAVVEPCSCECNRRDVCAGCGHVGCAERRLDLATVRGFGDMARAAFIALVMSVGRGCSEKELDRAMTPHGPIPGWVTKSSVQSHISAVRRTGLRVRFESRRYRVVDLALEQVDALVFRSLREQVRGLEPEPRDEQARAELIRLCRNAFELWVEDPAEAHAYVRDQGILAGEHDRYVALKAAFARTLLRAPKLTRSELAQARETIAELRRLDPGSPDVADLESRLSRRQTSNSPKQSPLTTVAAQAAMPTRPPWLPHYRDYLQDLVTSIDLRPFGSEVFSASSLATVYTPLHVKPRSTEQPRSEAQPEVRRPTLEAAVESIRAALVVGQPGSGKSTFLHHLCGRYLQDEAGPVPLLFELVEISAIGEEQLDGRGRLPGDVITRAFVDHLRAEGIPAIVDDVDYLSSSGQAVWLLDGLNEIPVSDVRRAVADVVWSCARRWRDSRFIVTTTQEHGVPLGLERVVIDHLQPADIEEFLEAFWRGFHSNLGTPPQMERLEPLVTEVLMAPDLRDLARTPLHLTAIALIYFAEGRLPDSRADLLKAAVSWLIRKRAPVLRKFVGRARDLELVFAELAYRMVATAKRPRSMAGKRWAAEQIAQLPVFDGHVEQAREFLEVAMSTSSLLVAKGPGDLGMHDFFRNYLAASVIAGKTDDEAIGWWGELAPHLDDPDWRHVLTLVPGCLLTLGSDRVDLFFDRLGKSALSRLPDVRVARVALGGRVLRELTLAGYRVGDAPHWHDAVRSVKEVFYARAGLPLEACCEAAVAYGLVGDDRLANFDVTWAWLDGGQYWMGAQAEDPAGRNYDLDAAPWESPVRLVTVAPFAIRKFPITVQEYQAFVDEGGYRAEGARWWLPEALEWRDQASVRAPLEWDEQLLAPNTPVTGVSWFECVAYCKWLTERVGGNAVYRLPYEQEWEYAARRGVEAGKQFRWGNRMHVDIGAEANWIGSFLRRKSPIGLFPQSTTPDGVADLFGNVEEWCLDTWDPNEDAFRDTPRTSVTRTLIQRSPGGSSAQGTTRIVRGGSCMRASRLCRSSYRSRILQHRRCRTVGFRPVRPADPRPDHG